MKSIFIVALAFCIGQDALAGAPSTPVSRVVQLIEQVAKQAEEEGKKEEDLYETYVCWAKSIIDAKTASNADAETRINELTQYIADIEAGRIEFTSERQDLEKELAQVNADMEEATAMREKEKADFEEAKDEMEKTIAALTDAVEVLKEATAKHQQGVLLQDAGSRLAAQSEASSAAALSYAMDLGDRFLSKGDAHFLRRLLSGEVPKADWKKLNRKATFKMSYKARSGKIQEVLASMLSTFEANLQDAENKEAEAQANYDKLMKTKGEQKKDAEESLLKMDSENGARGMNKEEAQAEVDALKTQVENDTKYIEQVKKSLAEKKEEWKERQALRAAEIAAMSKAISVLHSDDARDLMKKSFSSQGYFFLQTLSSSSKGSQAAEILRHTARDHGNRMKALAARALAPSHFKEVVAAIDAMIDVLKEEEAKDLEIKEECESDRARDSRKAVVLSRDIDEMTDKVTSLQQAIENLKEQVAKAEQDIKENQEELAQATRMRESENAEFKVALNEDKAVHEIILSATGVLKKFYSDNNLMLVQKAKKGPAGAAGEAPPPPPATWEAPYGGKTAESTGIIAILEMVAEDVQKDIAVATAAEEKAQAAYDQVKKDIEATVADLEQQISDMNDSIAEKEQTIEATKGDKRRSKKELESLMETMMKAAPNCDYFAVNYVVRTKNRQTEMDGLQKAKAILEGGKFDTVDENREIKPGDAFLQRQKS